MKLILDKDVEVSSILKLKKKFQNAKENDIVIMFFSGHGLLVYSPNVLLKQTFRQFHSLIS
jgi:hypothetical protein